jgi:hypothetical protein
VRWIGIEYARSANIQLLDDLQEGAKLMAVTTRIIRQGGTMKRRPILFLFLLILTGPACAGDEASAYAKKYPPYPDVWHRKIPEPREVYPNALSYEKAADGDIVILYARLPVKRPEDVDRSNGAVYFFSGKNFPEISYQHLKQTKLVRTLKELKLASGKTIKYENLDHRMPLRCPQQLNSYFVITDADGKVTRKSLLYILDKPQRYPVQERCVDTLEREFDVKVVAIQSYLLPLDDGTFLVKDGNAGIVIRFDANLKTKSPLLGRRLFWVDTQEIQRFRREGDVNYQAMHDAILAWLRVKQEADQ